MVWWLLLSAIDDIFMGLSLIVVATVAATAVVAAAIIMSLLILWLMTRMLRQMHEDRRTICIDFHSTCCIRRAENTDVADVSCVCTNISINFF